MTARHVASRTTSVLSARQWVLGAASLDAANAAFGGCVRVGATGQLRGAGRPYHHHHRAVDVRLVIALASGVWSWRARARYGTGRAWLAIGMGCAARTCLVFLSRGGAGAPELVWCVREARPLGNRLFRGLHAFPKGFACRQDFGISKSAKWREGGPANTHEHRGMGGWVVVVAHPRATLTRQSAHAPAPAPAPAPTPALAPAPSPASRSHTPSAPALARANARTHQPLTPASGGHLAFAQSRHNPRKSRRHVAQQPRRWRCVVAARNGNSHNTVRHRGFDSGVWPSQAIRTNFGAVKPSACN